MVLLKKNWKKTRIKQNYIYLYLLEILHSIPSFIFLSLLFSSSYQKMLAFLDIFSFYFFLPPWSFQPSLYSLSLTKICNHLTWVIIIKLLILIILPIPLNLGFSHNFRAWGRDIRRCRGMTSFINNSSKLVILGCIQILENY